MGVLTAQDLKHGGITAIKHAMEDTGEVVVSVRGKDRYVVMNIEAYHRIRELELDKALQEVQADIQAKRYVTESVDKHMKRIAP